MNAESVSVSIIVPVFNQWELVPDLLGCLSQQEGFSAAFEVLLVDNGSDQLPPPDGDPVFVRRLHCSTPGSYAARNRGVADARGALLVFTDADCQPAPGWLASHLAAIDAASGPTIVAGAVDVITNGPETAVSLYDKALAFPQQHYVRRGYGVTANLAVPRELFEQVGGFDTHRLSGGDADFCWRAASRGAKVIYCESARVGHPARESIDALVRKTRRLKGGQLRNGTLRRRVLCAARGFLPPFRAWWRIWRSPRLSFAQRIVVSAVQARLWLAEMAETVRLLSGSKAERR